MYKKIIGLLCIFALFSSNLFIVSTLGLKTTTLISENNDGKWTILVYIDGDNFIVNKYASDTLNYIEMVENNTDIRVIVQVDGTRVNDTKRFFMSYDGDMSSIGSEEIFDWGDGLGNQSREINMGDPNSLSDFIIWSINNYPSEHYLLSINDHGYGWDGLCIDEHSNNSYITLKELKNAFTRVSQNTNVDKLDVLYFDACDMGDIEVYYEIKEYVKYGVSSQDGVIADHNKIYQFLLENLSKDPNIEPVDVARELADFCFKSYSEVGNHIFKCYNDVSVIDLSKIENLAIVIDEFANILIDKLEENASYSKLITQASTDALRFLQGYSKSFLNIDICQLVRNIKFRSLLDDEVKEICNDILDILKNEVIIQSDSVKHDEMGKAHGLNIYLDYKQENIYDKYFDLDFADDTNWDEFIVKYLDVKEESENSEKQLVIFKNLFNRFPLLEQLFFKFIPFNKLKGLR